MPGHLFPLKAADHSDSGSCRKAASSKEAKGELLTLLALASLCTGRASSAQQYLDGFLTKPHIFAFDVLSVFSMQKVPELLALSCAAVY